MATERVPVRRRKRRGSSLALVLGLYLALGTILLGAVSLAAATAAAAERDYCRSQALALAEAGISEACARSAGKTGRGGGELGPGRYSWSCSPQGAALRVVARGEVTAASGATVTRTVRALLARSGRRWQVRTWEEGP